MNSSQPIVDDGPDFVLNYHDGEKKIAGVLFDLTARLRVAKSAKCTLDFLQSPQSDIRTFNFELDAIGGIINQDAAKFFAKHFGICLSHNPKSVLSTIKVPFKLFGTSEAVWHWFLDNTTAVQGAKAINYLLGKSPVSVNRPNAEHDFVSGVTCAPFPSLHRVVSSDMVVDSLAIALATHPNLRLGIEDVRLIEGIAKLFEAQEYTLEIYYLANVVKALHEVFEDLGVRDYIAAVRNFKDKVKLEENYFADSKSLLIDLANSLYLESFDKAKHSTDGNADKKLAALIEIFFQLNTQIPGNAPEGFITLDNSNKVGLALYGDNWGVA